MVIGITGNSGSGKTYISELFGKAIDAKIVNADKIVQVMSKPGSLFYEQIIKSFGSEFIEEDKSLNRKKLAELIFSNIEKREHLNKLTNTYIVPEIIKQIKECTIIDVPLLFESGLDKQCDITIGVIANDKIKIERIIQRDNITEELARLRLRAQAKDEFYIKNADFIIFNDRQDIQEQVNNILLKIRSKKCTIHGKN